MILTSLNLLKNKGGEFIIKICTINVPEFFIEGMEKLVGEDGLYPSRSEFIRAATREFLIKKLQLVKTLQEQEKEPEEEFDDKNYVRIPVENKDDEGAPSLTFKTYKIIKRLA